MALEGFRHTRATTRASALRPVSVAEDSRKGVRLISTCAREACLVAYCENVEKPMVFLRPRKSSR
eukprot:2421356-Pyramimonas_sp.AAC.1